MKSRSTMALAILVAMAALPAVGGDRPRGAPPAGGDSLLETPGGGALVVNRAMQTANALRKASLREARADFWLSVAIGLNDSGNNVASSLQQASGELDDALDLAQEQYDARIDLIPDLGGDAYDPPVDPAEFSSTVTNAYFPLVPGRMLIYHRVSAGGLEQLERSILSQTVDIAGIECRVVRDTETFNGVITEQTDDFFAQKSDGSVWYLGEITQQFEDGLLDSLDGSWRTGKDGAKPGIVMLASPSVDDVYREEFLPSGAEDVGRVISIGNTVTVPTGTYTNCIEIEDFSPMEPEEKERKFFAPGLGMVKEVDLRTGEVLQLVQIIN